MTTKPEKYATAAASAPGRSADDLVFPPSRGARLAARLRALDRTARIFAGMIVLSLVIIWLVFAMVVKASYREHWDDTSAYVENVAGLLAADLESNFEAYDLSLKALVSSLSDTRLDSLPPSLRRMAIFDHLAAPTFGSMVVIDKNGIIIDDSRVPVTKHVDVSDREYFRVQQSGEANGLYVSHPYKSRITGEYMVGVSRRVDKAGRFDGVALGTLNLDFFRSLFAKVHLPEGSTIALRYDDGSVLTSVPSGLPPLDRTQVSRERVAPNRWFVASCSDGVECLMVEHKIDGLPLFQTVGLPLSGILWDFRQRAFATAMAFLFLSAIIATLGIILVRELSRRNMAEAALRRLATIDGLTGLINKRCFDQRLDREMKRVARSQKPLALLMIDVDHFKTFNDTYGHSAGDEALRIVAGILAGEPVRTSDIVARVGGEEFVVLAPETNIAGAVRLAERIHAAIRQRRLPHAGSPLGLVTVSIGVACATGASDMTPRLLFDQADAALYRAKRGGRNRTEARPLKEEGVFGDPERLTA